MTSPVEIVFKKFASFTVKIKLDNTDYILEFNWNTSHEFWTMSIFLNDDEKTIVYLSLRLIVNAEILGQYKAYDNIPSGELWVVRSNGGSGEPGRNDFLNGNCGLVYEGVE